MSTRKWPNPATPSNPVPPSLPFASSPPDTTRTAIPISPSNNTPRTRARRQDLRSGSPAGPGVLDLIRFSPFGSFCIQCKTPISSCRGSLQVHLTKHPNISFQGFRMCDFVHFAGAEIEKLKSRDRSAYVKGDSFSGFSCLRCGNCFRRNDNASRHTKAKTNNCCSADIVANEICETVCGRLVTSASVSAPVPSGAQVPFKTTEEWLSMYVPGDEKVSQYLAIFHPLTQQGNCDETMSNLVDCWGVVLHDSELQLADLLQRAQDWIFNRARYDTGSVPANYRAAIQVFDGQDVGDVSINYTYNFRHFESSLAPELSKLLTFAWRRTQQLRGHDLLAGFKGSYSILSNNPFFVPQVLHALFIETVPNFFGLPVMVEYCLSRCFRKRVGVLNMIKCDLASSQIAAVMSILRAAVCGYLCSFHRDADRVAPGIVHRVRTSRVANTLSPFIRHLKEMHTRKGTKRMKTVSPEGDITVEGYEFPRSLWSKLIPNLFEMCKSLLSQLLVGDSWAVVFNTALSISVEISDYRFVRFKLMLSDSTVYNSDQILPDRQCDTLHLDRLVSYLSLGFFGSGGGAMRGTEVDGVALSQSRWHRNTLYYTSHSKKHFNFRSQNSAKSVEHKLPSVLARCFLLFRVFLNTKEDADLLSLVPERTSTKHTMNDATSELFNFASAPGTTQIRQFFTSVSDVLFPNSSWDGVITASDEVAEMSGHSAGTHSSSYSSNLLGGREMIFRVFHRELGGLPDSASVFTSIQLTKSELLLGLRCLVGPTAIYTSADQEKMVYLMANSITRHAHIGMACGSGKSMAWMVPMVARILAGRHRKTTIVVFPYKFLVNYHVFETKKKTNPVIDIVTLGFSAADIHESGPLPDDLLDRSLLPDLIFLSLDAMVNLIKYHGPTLTDWVKHELIHRFIIDEVHTIFGEGFRAAYEVLPVLPRYEVPIATMSGTVPKQMLPFLLPYLGLSLDETLQDMDLVESNDPIGLFPLDFQFVVVENTRPINSASKAVETILLQSPTDGIHILVATKKTGETIYSGLHGRFDCRYVSSDATKEEQTKVAREWGEGVFQVLVSTTIALVGNENPKCRHVVLVGYLHSMMNVIQAMGRLRPLQRTGGASIRIFVPVLNQESLDRLTNRESAAYEALKHRKLIGDDRQLFNRVATIQGLHDWLVKDDGCRIKTLARRFGFERLECRFCDVCRGKVTRRLGSVAAKMVQKENTTINRAMLVLKQMEDKCLHCNSARCSGEACLHNSCYRCGKNHLSRNCTETVTAKEVMNGRACYHCFDYHQRNGYELHESTNCPLQRRLRRMVFAKSQLSNAKFSTFLTSIYSDEASFYKFVASLKNSPQVRRATRFVAVQIKEGDESPLLPSDRLPGIEYDMKHTEAHMFNNFYKREPNSIKRKRGFTFGALYQNLFPGYFEVDHAAMGDVDLVVQDMMSNSTSSMKIRSAAADLELMESLVELGESMPSKGNCRRDLGDKGDMWGLGYRSKKKKILIYKQTGEPRTKASMKRLTGRVVEFMKEKYPEELLDIQTTERAGAKVPALAVMGGQNGPGSSIMLSRDLGNSAHVDFSDSSMSCSIWAERHPGRASNWYFVLPNMSINGSKGVVIRLGHGVAISWDGRIIRHCSSVTNLGDDNHVFGCMFGSCRD